MPRRSTTMASVMGALALTACATTDFASTWKAPDATRVTAQGQRVAALVMNTNDAARRAGEDALAREITAQGAEGVPMYSLISGDPKNEPQARAALEKAGIVGVVSLRPVGKDKNVYSTPTVYAGPSYGGFWGGYYGYGWGAPWGVAGGEIRTDTIVSVETLVYSLKDNKLIWAGESRTTNPTNVDGLVREIVTAAAKEMKKQGLL